MDTKRKEWNNQIFVIFKVTFVHWPGHLLAHPSTQALNSYPLIKLLTYLCTHQPTYLQTSHSPLHPLTHSPTHPWPLTYLSTHSPMHSPTYLYTHFPPTLSQINPPSHSLTHPLINSSTHPFVYSPTQPLFHSLITKANHQPLILHPLTQSFTYYSFTQPCTQFLPHSLTCLP